MSELPDEVMTAAFTRAKDASREPESDRAVMGMSVHAFRSALSVAYTAGVSATRRQAADDIRARRCCAPDDPECCCCHELGQASAAIARGRGEAGQAHDDYPQVPSAADKWLDKGSAGRRRTVTRDPGGPVAGVRVEDWNPCATCDCRAWCFARCCYRHNDMDANCRPEALCCPLCPEQFHPEHPVGIDCNRTADKDPA